MISQTYATLALGLGPCELEALAWTLSHLPLHQQLACLLNSLGFVKFYLGQASTVPQDILNYMYLHVQPWYGAKLPYYYRAGKSWQCVQIKEKHHDKVKWIQIKRGHHRHYSLKKTHVMIHENNKIKLSHSQVCEGFAHGRPIRTRVIVGRRKFLTLSDALDATLSE